MRTGYCPNYGIPFWLWQNLTDFHILHILRIDLIHNEISILCIYRLTQFHVNRAYCEMNNWPQPSVACLGIKSVHSSREQEQEGKANSTTALSTWRSIGQWCVPTGGTLYHTTPHLVRWHRITPHYITPHDTASQDTTDYMAPYRITPHITTTHHAQHPQHITRPRCHALHSHEDPIHLLIEGSPTTNAT